MAGYSGTPLPKKLGIKDGARVALLNAPPGFARRLEPMPPGVSVSKTLAGATPFDVIVLFAANIKALNAGFTRAAAKLTPAGGLWVGWPKKSSGVRTDVTEPIVREVGLAAGLVDNKVCAIDETWSGLRFVVRVKDRPKSQPARKRRPG